METEETRKITQRLPIPMHNTLLDIATERKKKELPNASVNALINEALEEKFGHEAKEEGR